MRTYPYGRCRGLPDPPPDHFRELFLGPPGRESEEQRAGRLAAARDVLADLLDEGASDGLAMEDALHAVCLGGAAILRFAGRRRAA